MAVFKIAAAIATVRNAMCNLKTKRREKNHSPRQRDSEVRITLRFTQSSALNTAFQNVAHKMRQ